MRYIDLYKARIDAENGYTEPEPETELASEDSIEISQESNQDNYCYFHNECHDPDTGRFCENPHSTKTARVEIASHDEKIEAKRKIRNKIKHAPVPSPKDVEKRRNQKSTSRAGGDLRTNSEGRKILQRKIWEEFGGHKRGFIVDAATGIKMHYSADPQENPNLYPVFTLGRIFTPFQGGGYDQTNIIPELLRSNQKRGRRTVRPENLT